jgi:hypothetical protein
MREFSLIRPPIAIDLAVYGGLGEFPKNPWLSRQIALGRSTTS